VIRVLARKFIKDHENVTNRDVRESYGVLAGVLGIICNVFLFGLKLALGFITNSIAVTSDAFNNLSDTGTSVVAILGAKLSNRPPDDEHPYGHGRLEYIASLVVSFIILVFGLNLLKSSFDKILNRQEAQFSTLSLAILAASILVKVWMFSYNSYVARTISSGINKAAASDSLNDIVATSAVVAGSVLGRYTTFPVDGVLGLVISGLIMYTGYGAAKEAVDSLLGMLHDPEIAAKISAIILQGSEIEGAHDLKIHDYGPGRTAASIHVEVANDVGIVEIHTEIDRLERRIHDELGVNIVIHMDPEGTVDAGDAS